MVYSEIMKLTKYQKRFGVGPAGLAISVALLFLLGLLDKWLGHIEILSRRRPAAFLGIVLLCIEVCWQIWSISALRVWLREERLCTKGPYRFVRHPIYVGAIFFVYPGIALLFNSWIMLLCPILMFPVWTFLIRREETIMASLFGEDYAHYAAQTGRLFPRLLRK
jgi:protein-S-isoprenylcysteine O-methyltransferase Ste14